MNDAHNDLQRRYDRLLALYQVANVIHSTLEPEEALQLIVSQAAKLLRANSGSVALINPTTGFLEILAAEGLPAKAAELKLRVGEGITGWVARANAPARVGDVRQDPRYIMLRAGVRSELAVPIEISGMIRGVLNVDSDRPEAFTADDQELLEGIAAQACYVIQNTWLFEQFRLKARLFESLVTVSQTINSTLSLDDALNTITREACLLARARMCSLLLLDENGQWLDLRSSYGAGEAYLRKPRLSVSESLVGSVVRRKKPYQVENVQASSLYQNTELARQEGLFGLLSVPLVFTGNCIGTLNVYTDRPYSFSNEEIRVLSALAQLSGIAIEKARLYERVVHVEEQLRQNEKLSALGLLAAEVAHEIRNPLTVMKMLYHSLNLQFPPGDPREKDALIMGEKMDHLNKIVERVLDFARTAEPRFTPVDLPGVIEELALLVRHKLKEQNVTLRKDWQPGLPPVSADAPQLEQAFLNLILNALEAMPGGGTLTVACRTSSARRGSPQPTHVAVEFKDTGSGMPEEHRQRAFSSVLNTTKTRGTGLGLAIVRRIVEAHRGKLKIKSRTGEGTLITVLLPVAAS